MGIQMNSSEIFRHTRWNDTFFILEMLATAILAMHCGEFIYRLYVFFNEILSNEKQLDKMKVFKTTMSAFGFPNLFLVVVCSVLVAWLSSFPLFNLWIILPFCISYVFLHVIGIWKPTPTELKRIYGDQVNFGYCFAWQYYIGYLKIILPDFGKRISEFETERQCELIVKKLMLLVPKSCQIVNDFSCHPGDEKIIESVGSISKEVNRSGNKGREYKNTIYRIHHDPKPIYCCMESITMLNSLSEIKKKWKLRPEKVEEEFHNFISCLQRILQKENQQHLVELIIYDDVDDKGNSRKLSDVVKTRLAELITDGIQFSC
ncbi:hypothetical protein CHUAL_008390 [Chamberlinius hualienensis]